MCACLHQRSVLHESCGQCCDTRLMCVCMHATMSVCFMCGFGCVPVFVFAVLMLVPLHGNHC